MPLLTIHYSTSLIERGDISVKIIATIAAIILSFIGLIIYASLISSEGFLPYYNVIVMIICTAVILHKLDELKKDK